MQEVFALVVRWNIQLLPRKIFSRTTGFISFSVAVNKAKGMQNTIISDNIHICLDDFKPEDSIMQRLFKNLLDHHISFVEIPGTKNSENRSEVGKKLVKKSHAKKRPAKKQIHSKKKISKK